MAASIQDGRLQNHKQPALQRTEENGSLLVQALETNDADLLDWCVENTSPPKELSSLHLSHLLHFLASRFWVYSTFSSLNWIHSLLASNIQKMHHAEEFRPVLEDLSSKLKAKTQGFKQLAGLKDMLHLVTDQNYEKSFTIISEAHVTVNEEA